jgi:hypothetical protein
VATLGHRQRFATWRATATGDQAGMITLGGRAWAAALLGDSAGGGERCCLRMPELCSHGSAARDVLPAQASRNRFGLLAVHRQEEEDKDRCGLLAARAWDPLEDKDRCGLLALYCWTTENSL